MNNLRNLPKIDKLLLRNEFKGLNHRLLAKIAKEFIQKLREQILSKEAVEIDEDKISNAIIQIYNEKLNGSLKKVINLTGIIIHTNLGRSLISSEIYDKTKDRVCSYSNLEYDLQQGKRDQRYSHLTKLFKELLGFEEVLVVNNNAAAVFLVLNTFAKNKEVVLSRGELVEIGGSFRIPEVMKASGAILKEIGTTNKTNIKDYEKAINDKTAMLMKVHKSNFSIEGFSEEVDIDEIVKLSNKTNLINYYDLGSGFVGKLPYNLSKFEKSLEELSNVDLISFSGDKLFGSVQAGIIAGKEKFIKELQTNQLLRMLRVDKINICLIEESLRAYLEQKTDLIPTVYLLNRSIEQLEALAKEVQESLKNVKSKIIQTQTYVGGGAMPNKKIPSVALVIEGNAKELEQTLRKNYIIARIENDEILLDFRALMENEVELLKQKLGKIFE